MHVTKKKIMKKTKKLIAAADPIKLADVVGLGDKATKALDRVFAIGEEAGRELDMALAGPA